MSWPQTSMPAANTALGDEPYLPVEEVAHRLDLPLGILLRRVEAGDVPSRREEGPGGVRYLVRLGDLGIESPMSDVSPQRLPPPTTAPTRRSSIDAATRRWHRPHPDRSDVGRNRPSRLPGLTRSCHHRPRSSQQRRPHRARRIDDRDRFQRAAARCRVDDLAGSARTGAGLLDRWERTLEQRIYSEQRQRFEAELNARQNLVKQLQLELQTARAEHAAAQAEKDRRLADRDRRISDLEAGARTRRTSPADVAAGSSAASAVEAGGPWLGTLSRRSRRAST